jgi:hypothetical protein
MFNFFKPKIKIGEIWFYDPTFPDTDRGLRVRVLEIGEKGIQISNIDGNFKPIMSKDMFFKSFKKFK